jgi:penicillin-binding protein 1C
MRRVSGVTGAAPVLRAVMDFLHDRVGSSWYANPPTAIECPVDPLTGRRLPPDTDHPSIPEVFVDGILPAQALATDYDPHGRVRLPAEYHEWSLSPDNWLAGQIVVTEPGERARLRLVAPLPGSTYFVDPDLPDASRWLRLRAEGSAHAVWESATLKLREEQGVSYALLEPGRHDLSVHDLATGQRAGTWINVRQL